MAAKEKSKEANEEVRLESLRAAEAYGSGMRTTLRHNATAYGFSVSITAAFGLVSTTHAQSAFPLRVLLFAAGAGAAFILVEAVAALLFQRAPGSDADSVLLLEGAVDVLSILAAVGAAMGMANIPGLVAWPATAFGATIAYLVVGGLDVLVARVLARGSKAS